MSDKAHTLIEKVLAGSPDESVRQNAARALAILATKSSLTKLAEIAITDEDEKVRAVAVDELLAFEQGPELAVQFASDAPAESLSSFLRAGAARHGGSLPAQWAEISRRLIEVATSSEDDVTRWNAVNAVVDVLGTEIEGQQLIIEGFASLDANMARAIAEFRGSGYHGPLAKLHGFNVIRASAAARDRAAYRPGFWRTVFRRAVPGAFGGALLWIYYLSITATIIDDAEMWAILLLASAPLSAISAGLVGWRATPVDLYSTRRTGVVVEMGRAFLWGGGFPFVLGVILIGFLYFIEELDGGEGFEIALVISVLAVMLTSAGGRLVGAVAATGSLRRSFTLLLSLLGSAAAGVLVWQLLGMSRYLLLDTDAWDLVAFGWILFLPLGFAVGGVVFGVDASRTTGSLNEWSPRILAGIVVLALILLLPVSLVSIAAPSAFEDPWEKNVPIEQIQSVKIPSTSNLRVRRKQDIRIELMPSGRDLTLELLGSSGLRLELADDPELIERFLDSGDYQLRTDFYSASWLLESFFRFSGALVSPQAGGFRTELAVRYSSAVPGSVESLPEANLRNLGVVRVGSIIEVASPNNLNEGPGWVKAEMDPFANTPMTVTVIEKATWGFQFKVRENTWNWDARWIVNILPPDEEATRSKK